jgi:hypothetical protein
LDYSPLLSADTANYYQQLIGVLRWIVELGRLDMHIHTAMMSSHMMQPREGHLKEVLHVSIHALERLWEHYKAPRTSGAFEGTLQGA